MMKNSMRLWKAFPILFLLAGCLSQPASQANPGGGSNSPAQPTAAPVKLTNGPFALTIFAPADQAVVSIPKVDLHGQVSADAVLTVNADTFVLKRGEFTQSIPLETGLNSLQIVASDMDGNEIDLVLTITYQP
jgi:hypothetical protein